MLYFEFIVLLKPILETDLSFEIGEAGVLFAQTSNQNCCCACYLDMISSLLDLHNNHLSINELHM